MDKGISPEVVRAILVERAHLPCLAAKSAYKVSINSGMVYSSVRVPGISSSFVLLILFGHSLPENFITSWVYPCLAVTAQNPIVP